MTTAEWVLLTLATLLCAFAAASAVYLAATEAHTSRRPTRFQAAHMALGYHEPALLPLERLRGVIASIVVQGGPRIRIGGALSGLAGVVLVAVVAGDIRLLDSCASVCVVRAQDTGRDERDAVSAAALTQAAVSMQPLHEPEMPRSPSNSVNPGGLRLVATSATPAGTGATADEPALVAQWTSRGLAVAADSGGASCLEAGIAPRVYRASRNGGVGQRALLLVYPTASALNADWATEGGSPLGYRGHGACGRGGTIYWNQNVVLILPELTDNTTRQILADAFFAMR